MPVCERTSEELAQRQLDAYNSRNLEAFVACYAEDVEVRHQGSDELVLRGREQMKDRYGPMFANSPDLHCEIVKRIVMGSFVFDQELVTGRGPEPLRVVAIYDVRDALIRRVWFARPG